MEEISWSDRMKNEEVLHRVEEESSLICFKNVSPVTLPRCSFNDQYLVAEDTNTETYEEV